MGDTQTLLLVLKDCTTK